MKEARRTGWIATMLLLTSLAACKKPVAEEAETPPEIVQATPPPATPQATPIAVATPEPNYFAPPGIYFLLTAASVETAEGIHGLKPGTRLEKTAPRRYTADGFSVELSDLQVTNDLRVAQRVVGLEQAAQSAIRKSLAAAQPASMPNQASYVVPMATPNTVVARAKPTASTITRRTTALGSSGALGRTKSQDGWIWQTDASGNWQPLRPDR